MSALREYYLTNYTTCPRCDTFLCSWRDVSYTSHFLTAFSFPVYLFGGYCILYKSPKEMSSYRVPLFNFHVWTCLADVFLNCLVTPYIFLPTLTGFSVGLLNFLGVPPKIQVWLAFQSLNFMLLSTTILVENRNNATPFNKFKITRKSTKATYYLTKLLIGVLYAASFTFFIPANQDEALFKVLRRLPCPSQEFFTGSNIFVLCIDDYHIQFLIAFTVLGVLAEVIQILFYLTCCVYYLFFSIRSFTSKTTRKLQIKFLASILLQISIPVLFMLPTAFYIWFAVDFNYYNQALTNLSILHSSIHGLISTFTVLIIHYPYRQFVLSYFRKSEQKQSVRIIEIESVMITQIVIK
ncbi:Serpentine Receptor, class H [Caenorhabditis elegans]|uniref:Serpentine Receptor, class H n=1 Tax=Caenorhabditis elegans TaxID=6239 RepID=Q8IFY2_CAEEL|nr:Serpentine Receptor, class H [Caenorhabditis elegans]CCD67251.1 Serpentine Receptor, class H [Caenorhabditis elegans]|eukprot:NP_503807.1 Serpentine Receptor, class H [Caenorhabditis elegans]